MGANRGALAVISGGPSGATAGLRAVGRFLPLKDVPTSGIEYVAQKLGVECETRVLYSQATSTAIKPLSLNTWVSLLGATKPARLPCQR